MHRDEARQVLARLHRAQNTFYGGGGSAALRELLAEDVVWHVPGSNVISGAFG